MRTLAEWLSFQDSLHPATIDLTLERVTHVARLLEVEKPGFAVITVAGTNGTGSTASLCAALLTAAGVRTGLFTSPHLLRYSERIQVDGREVSEAELLAAFERIERTRGSTTLTFFEHSTLAALLIFRERGVRAAVLEVGLGGRLDATNLVDADVAVLSSVGLDHRDWLGDSLDAIGAEKAGILRAGRPAVLGSAEMPASVANACRRLGVKALTAGTDFTWQTAEDGSWCYDSAALSLAPLPPPALAGDIQYRNAATALTAVQALLTRTTVPPRTDLTSLSLTPPVAPVALTSEIAARALRAVRLPGRFQVIERGGVEWILDIAHNEPAARVLAEELRKRPAPSRTGRTWAVTGILQDKDARAIAQLMEELVDHWFLCSLPGPRGTGAQQLLERTGLTVQAAAQVSLASSVQEGCERAAAEAQPGDRIVVFGSVYTVGPALDWLGRAGGLATAVAAGVA